MKLQVVSITIESGGPEALHQLAFTARSIGIDARIVYTPFGTQHGITPRYACYDVPVDMAIDDSAGTVVVFPETLAYLVRAPKRARVAIWWLSVDNYFATLGPRPLRRRIAELLHLRRRPFLINTPTRGVLHLAQSEYSRQFLERHVERDIWMLTDYLNTRFDALARAGFEAGANRGARVAFNPRKGYAITQSIRAAAPPELEFVPLEGLSVDQLLQVLRSCAVYIDFGHHPGRDRLPREAALAGCVVITGRQGAAANDVDIPINAHFKLDERASGFVATAVRTISECINDYPKRQAEFAAYRETILQQREVFVHQVRQWVEDLRKA